MLPVFKRFYNLFLDTLFPPRCLNCSGFVSVHGTFCDICFSKIRFITLPYCKICGRPLEFELEDERLCLSCQKKKRPYKLARALFKYDSASKGVILKFKHADGTDLLKPFARRILLSYADLIERSDYIVPVPLHYSRLLKRKYNQAALLARALSRKKFNPFVLVRIKKTKSQGHFTRAKRLANVKGAFDVSEKYRAFLKNKKILLIDDVMASGATVEEAAKTLLKFGVKSVEVLTLGVV